MNVHNIRGLLLFSLCWIAAACASPISVPGKTPQSDIPNAKELEETNHLAVTPDSVQLITPTLENTKPSQESATPTSRTISTLEPTGSPDIAETMLLKFNPQETNDIYMEASPDGRSLAYKRFSNEGESVIYNGEEFGPYDEAGFIAFSPDSQHLVFIASIGDKDFAVLDGIEQTQYDQILASARFSKDSQHLAYEAEQGSKTLAVIDQTEFTYDDLSSSVKFSPDGNRFAFVARNINAEYFVVLDGIEGKKYDEIEIYNLDLYFSTDGSHLAYVAREGEDWFVVLDGVESAPFSASTIDIVFSPDSQHFVYAANTGGQKVLFFDSEEMNEYDNSSSPVFSQDSQHFAYKGSLNDKIFVVVDGIEGPKHDGIITGFTFSPDGQRYAYQNDTDDQNLLVIDGEIQPEEDVRRRPLFSPDSQHIAYRQYDSEGDTIYLDGEKIGKYDEIKYMTFSPDSKHLLFIAQDDGTWVDYIVIDGVKGVEFDEILRQINFDSDDNFHYLAIRGDAVYLVEEKIR